MADSAVCHDQSAKPALKKQGSFNSRIGLIVSETRRQAEKSRRYSRPVWACIIIDCRQRVGIAVGQGAALGVKSKRYEALSAARARPCSFSRRAC